MKRILIPTDFSVHAEEALKVAAQIAKENNSEIYLLHMLELPTQMNYAIAEDRNIPETVFYMKKAHEAFQKIKESPYLDGIPVIEAVQFEKAFSGILSFSKKNDVDLIIMGSHGASGIEEILIGSNTEKVVRMSEIPVMVIKKGLDEYKMKNFVFASDFADESKKPFQKMVDFAKSFDAAITLVTICTPNSFKTTATTQKTMENFAAEFDFKKHSMHIYNAINIEKGILEFAGSANADLIGICTHGRTGLSHFFNGSISEDIVNHTATPVITFKI